ncbi:MAG: hypothetical protein WBL95_11330 [Microcoleus sp.]
MTLENLTPYLDYVRNIDIAVLKKVRYAHGTLCPMPHAPCPMPSRTSSF